MKVTNRNSKKIIDTIIDLTIDLKNSILKLISILLKKEHVFSFLSSIFLLSIIVIFLLVKYNYVKIEFIKLVESNSCIEISLKKYRAESIFDGSFTITIDDHTKGKANLSVRSKNGSTKKISLKCLGDINTFYIDNVKYQIDLNETEQNSIKVTIIKLK